MIYAMMMGLGLAVVYERYGRLLAAPVLFHCAANMVVYVLSKGNAFSGGDNSLLYGIVLLIVAAAISFKFVRDLLKKRNRR